MEKQDVIKKVYGSRYDFLKPDENGWFKDEVLGNSETLSVWALSECERKWDDNNELVWRLTSLAGIEDNNGWLPLDASVPNIHSSYFVCDINQKDRIDFSRETYWH